MHIGIVYEALLRLVALAGDSWESLTRMFQRVIDDPLHRRQVFAALSGINAQMVEMTKADWVEREMAVFQRLAEFGIPLPTREGVEAAWREGFGPHHRFVPQGLKRRQLLEACLKAGINMGSRTAAQSDCDGEALPTETGTLRCELERIMVPTDGRHRPFMLTHDQQVEWAAEQGGEGLHSAEEFLYTLLRAWIELGRIPYMGGWTRCRNAYGSDDTLYVDWDAGYGLRVRYDHRSLSDWDEGAVAREFTPA